MFYFRLDIRKSLLSDGVVRHWNRMSREELESPSLEVFRKHGGVYVGTWFIRIVALSVQLDMMIFMVFSNLSESVIIN